MQEIIIQFFIEKFERLIKNNNELLYRKDLNDVNNNDISLKMHIENNNSETRHYKVNLVFEAINKFQKHLSDKILLLAKVNEKKMPQSEDENKKENIDNEIQMQIIKTHYQEIFNFVKKINFNFQTYFKINEIKTANFNERFLPNVTNENSIFEEFKFNPLIFFEEIRQAIKAIFNKFTSEIKKLQQKTIIVYNNKCFKHCDFSNYDPISRIKKRNYLVENPDRLNVLFQQPFGIFLSDFFSKNYEFVDQSKPGCLADIVKIHDYDYVMKIKSMCESSCNRTSQIMKFGTI